MRRAGLLSLGFALAFVSAPGAQAAKPLQVRLVLPAPGHVGLTAIKTTVSGRSLGAPAVRVRFSLPNSHALPKGAALISAVQANRSSTALTYTLLFAIVNPARTLSRLPAGPGDCTVPTPMTPLRYLYDIPTGGPPPFGLKLLYGPVHQPLCPTYKWLQIPREVFYADFGHHRTKGVAGWSEAVNADLGSGAERAKASVALTRLLSVSAPSTLPTLLVSPGVSIGIYTNAHPGGFGFNTPLAKEAVRDAFSVLSTPQPALQAIVQKLDLELGGEPPPPPKQQLYKFSFGPLGLTFDDTAPVQSGSPIVEPWSVQIDGGTACGSKLASAAFEIPWSLSGPGGTQQKTNLDSFAANPFRFYSFTDTTTNSALAMDLHLLTGSFPSVRLEATTTGSSISDLVFSRQQAAVTVTPVGSC